MADFSSLIQLSFGINLALPVLRELILFSRHPIDKKLVALESLIKLRPANSQLDKDLISRLSKIKRELIICDENLSKRITVCSIITFMFSLTSLYWMWFAAFNKSCLDTPSTLLYVWSGFIPLPLCAAYLYFHCSKSLVDIHKQMEELKSRCIGSF